MVRQASLRSDLESITGVENTRSGSEDIAVDGLTPEAVARPTTVESAAEIIRYANAHDLAIIPLGGRCHRSLGNVPSRYDIALDTTALSAIVEYEPEDLTITCQAGITLGALRAATGAAGQMVPFDPSIPDAATVGGVLAADVWGPARMSLGAPRDFTIGLRVITGDGVVTRAGGRVVKNVAGYDLCKLYIGSLGTLAVITEASFKVQPLPKEARASAFEFASASDACRVPNEALMHALAMRSAAVTRTGERWLLSIVIGGAPSAVERSAREIAALASDAGGEEPAEPVPALEQLVACRLSMLPSELPAQLETLASKLGAYASLVAYPTLGAIRAGLLDAGALERASLPGVARVIEAAPPEAKRGIDVFGEPPASLPLMQAAKEQFDPKAVLSPGRFVDRL
ncbi:MAG: FAD-binding oxidoreductase [Dehalococcoidia bacterium]